MRNAQNIAQDMVAEKREGLRRQSRWGDLFGKVVVLGIFLSVLAWAWFLIRGTGWALGVWK